LIITPTDNTVAIAREYTDLVFSKGPERSAQRNFGMIEKSQGDFVMYVDADMILAPELIGACVQYMKSPSVVALHIPEVVLGKNYFSKVRNFERSFYDGTSVDGARFFDKKSFAMISGFDVALFKKGSGEDWDIDKSIKSLGAIGLVPRSVKSYNKSKIWPLFQFIGDRGIEHRKDFAGIYHNESEFMLGAYLKKKAYYTLGFDGYIKKWSKADPDIKKQFGFTYRYFWVFVEETKWKKLIKNPLLTLGMYFLRFLVGLVYFSKKIGLVESGVKKP
jgi:glycosyltransferase involved in cell wall biosynthesis